MVPYKHIIVALYVVAVLLKL